LGVNQVEGIIETHFAAGLGTGNISYYNNANILQNAPVFLIGSAISTAVFPRLSKRISMDRPDLMRADFLKYLRMIIWMIMPVTVICFFARGYLAHLIFARDSKQIASIFGFMAGAIIFSTIYTIISRWFFANK